MQPTAYQLETFERFKNSDTMALFLRMRLGKSLVAVMWAEARAARRILLLSPLSPQDGWTETLTRLGEDWSMLDKRKGPTARWSLCTYGLLTRNPELTDLGWDCVILDESTAIKSPTTKITKLVLKRLTGTRCRAILTGEPTPETILDCWPQMAFLLGGEVMGHDNFWSWRREHCRQAGFDWYVKPNSAAMLKNLLHAHGRFLTREEVDVGGPKIYHRIVKPMSDEQAEALAYLRKEWALPWTSNPLKTSASVVIVAHRISGGNAPPGMQLPTWKYEEAVRIAKRHGAAVVWCSYSLELVRVVRAARAAGIKATFVQGRTTRAERSLRRKAFEAGTYDLIAVQSGVGRYGLDLSRAKAAIYLSSPYSYETRLQSEDRVIHMRKREPSYVYDLIAEGSLDEVVLESVAEKNESAEWVADRAGLRRPRRT